MLGQVGHGALEPGIVVGGHLVGDVVVPRVVVVVPLIGAPDEGAVEGLRVGIRAVLLGVAAGGRDGAAAGAGPVVGSERGIDSEADHIAPASVSEDVMDLFLNKVVAL